VTIITPSYNRAGYLAETIDSVLGQGYPNLEYIVLDDGSTDDTLAVVGKYKDRLTFAAHANMGEARTVNKGLAMARGEIIGIVNSDDPILPGLVWRAVEAFRAGEELLFAYPDWMMIDDASRPLKRVRAHDYDYERMLRWQKCFIGPGAFMHRRALRLEAGRDPTYRFAGDFEYWLRLGLHGPSKRIPEVLATQRLHAGSASSDRGEAIALEYIRVADEYFARSGLPDSLRRARAEARANAIFLAGRACMEGSLPLARRYFVQSLRTEPFAYLRWRPQRLVLLLVAFLPEGISDRVHFLLERLVKSPAHYYHSG
jgi:glycosyltransferase involved in cell wall biosynthesis